MKNNPLKKGTIKQYVVLHIALLITSLTSVFSKYASNFEVLSFNYILFYGIMIFCLGIYALMWQQIIKKMPLVTAFCNKAITVIWGIIWGVTLFGETIYWNMIVGAIIIIAGVLVVVTADE